MPRRLAFEDALAAHLIAAVRAAGGYGGGIYMRSRDRRTLVLAMVAGVPSSVIRNWWRLPVSGALPAPEAYRTGRPVHLADEGETMRRFPQLSVGMPYRFASHCQPVRVGDEVVGILYVLWAAGKAPAPDGLGGPGGPVFSAAEDMGRSLTAMAAAGWRVEYEDDPISVRLPAEVAGVRVGLIDWDLDAGVFVADDEACAVLGVDPDDFGGTIADLEWRVCPDDLHELRGAERDLEERGWVRGRTFRVRDTSAEGDETHGGAYADAAGGEEARYRPVELWARSVQLPLLPPAPGRPAVDGGPPSAEGPPSAGGAPESGAPPSVGGSPASGAPRSAGGAPESGAPPPPGAPPSPSAPPPSAAPPPPTGPPPPVHGPPPSAPAAGSRRLVGVVVDAVSGTTAAEAAERLPDGVFSLDQDGRLTYANRSAEELLRTPRAELLGRYPWHMMPWLSDPEYEDRYRAAMLSQEPTSFIVRHPAGEWLGFVLYPDVHGLTGRVFPSKPPPRHVWPGVRREPVPRAAMPHAAAVTRPGALYAVVHMASVLTEAVSVREVCRAVADHLMPMIGGHELALYLVRNKRMFLAWESGYPEGFLDRFEGVGLDERLPGVETMTTGVPIFFESPRQLSDAYPGIVLDPMRAWAFLPLIASGQAVGSCILGFEAPRVFTADERATLTALAGLAAQALERARLYDAEFALARGLQTALLPHRLPPVPGLRTAGRYLPGTQGMEIGGDWYDVIESARGVALVIGDVEGHSVAAAAVMGQLRSAVIALAPAAAGPGEVVSRTNRLLMDLDAGLCATCCYIELDPRTGTGLGVRAGHPPPVLRRPDGRTEVLDLAGGTMLGVVPLGDYPVTPVTLPRGAVLALYTDGLVEQPGQDIDEGVAELSACLARTPTDSLESMADGVIQVARRTEDRPDDVALLLTMYAGL
ncbi:SpoIIE family protein phosphatase [Streptomyces sp. P1-3]|uniref:SpoIIE family protein phosphatase n=1 Tax=Streptomyces sp. P1-3 TaxID=3421658 RepID=UPI003D35EDD0